ncbi:MAG TPA: hypothetical protein DEP35_08610 [Deltaproteobacteria bacterium]|nr:hypothetical protein [Deltaproteobacteria bacterium]
MAVFLPKEGKPFPLLATLRAWTSFADFRLIYLAIFAFLLLTVTSVRVAERLLLWHFQRSVAEAVRVDPFGEPLATQLQERIDRVVPQSPWVRWGGVRVSVLVMAADGLTPLYVGGRSILSRSASGAAASRLLPATPEVTVNLPYNAVLSNVILIGYASVLLWALFAYNRAAARREEEGIATAVAARDATAARAVQIERELFEVQRRLSEVEPAEESQQEEIRELQAERAGLQQKLAAVEQREQELRAQAVKSADLDRERRTLEEMLDEALGDVSRREEEIRALEARLKRAAKEPHAGGRAREAEHLGRRLRTLYKGLEIDDRAIEDLVELRDEAMKLKAEEALKRLSDEPDTAAIRRKVGGLPPHLAIFELGFAGKGRIYYQRGEVRRYRILTIGAKNSQKTDLEYLSRLP